MNHRTIQINDTVINPQNHSNNLGLNSKRQYRLLLAILEKPRATNELIRIVGANNIPDVVKKLRNKGWAIHTLNSPVYDRDNNKVDAGSYKLDLSQVEKAIEALKSFKGGEE